MDRIAQGVLAELERLRNENANLREARNVLIHRNAVLAEQLRQRTNRLTEARRGRERWKEKAKARRLELEQVHDFYARRAA